VSVFLADEIFANIYLTILKAVVTHDRDFILLQDNQSTRSLLSVSAHNFSYKICGINKIHDDCIFTHCKSKPLNSINCLVMHVIHALHIHVQSYI